MIERVSFANFKSLRKLEATLGRFTVIVGPNGSGKTSLLDGLDYLAQATQKPIASILTGAFAPQNLQSRDTTEPMKLALSGRFQGIEAEVRIAVTCEESAGGPPKWSATVARRWGETEEQTFETREGVRQLSKRVPLKPGAPKPPPPPPPTLTTAAGAKVALRAHQSHEMATLARELGSARKLRLDVERLAAPSYSKEETPRLASDGTGVASVLADAAGRSPELFQSIGEAARQVIPTLERIRTRRAKVHEQEQQEIRIDEETFPRIVDRAYWGQQIVLDFKGAPDVAAPLASEGTLLVIGLLTALWTEPRPRLLLLDDIDKALHPRAQGELVAQLRKVLEMDPELQIVATSHSPYLLDHFDAQHVLVTALASDGSTVCAPLTDHPDFERWKGTTRAGELWSFLGEEWITQRASAAQTPG